MSHNNRHKIWVLSTEQGRKFTGSFGIPDIVMLKFIILFSKTMSELKNMLGLAMEIQGNFSLSICLLMTSEEHSEERTRNVEFGSVIYCDDKKVVQLDSQGICALCLQVPYSHLKLSVP